MTVRACLVGLLARYDIVTDVITMLLDDRSCMSSRPIARYDIVTDVITMLLDDRSCMSSRPTCTI